MPSSAANGLLQGLNVLVVEDNYLQAEQIRLCLVDAGAIVHGPAVKLEETAELISMNGVDTAVIDINLGDGPDFDVAGHLLRANLPFMFVTGYNCRELPEEFKHISCLQKPFLDVHLVRALVNIGTKLRP